MLDGIKSLLSHSDNKKDRAALYANTVDRSLAVIEFDSYGKVLSANQNFLSVMGYSLSEIVGRHHSLFVDKQYASSRDYDEFWRRLRNGEFLSGEFQRFGKDDVVVWIQATYTPVIDSKGVVTGVIKFASDITRQKEEALDRQGQIEAIHRSQAVIEFSPDGIILQANQNFLDAMGYRADEIVGRHHRIFVDEVYASTQEYQHFWATLARGEYHVSEYKRFGKGHREIWIQATYNPILDGAGRVTKVVKFATDVTRQKLLNADMAGQVAAIGKSQAVIEFTLDGIVINANENFLSALGYRIDEVRGKHHRMFVEPVEQSSSEYSAFWDRLKGGRYEAGEFRRVARGGREIFIQASYNPILDLNGRPFKVVKFATDVTSQVVARKRNEIVRNKMEEVVAGTTSMNDSVAQISKSMAKCRDSTGAAVEAVNDAGSTTANFDAAAVAMGGMVSLIHDIADKINLLALNATIESARAGEAGRGFAVVAQEVKLLAAQTKSATEKITGEISGVRALSTAVSDALARISSSTANVMNYVDETSRAIESQALITTNMTEQMNVAAAEAAKLG